MSLHRCPARRTRAVTFRPVGRLLRPLLTFMAALLLTLGVAPLALLGPAGVAYAAGDLTVLVYNDGGRNGIYVSDASHPGVSLASVSIYSSDNILVGLVNTNAIGLATFPNLADGAYRLEVRPPSNFVVSVPGLDNPGLVSFVTISGGAATVRVGLRPLSGGADLVAPAGTRSIVVRLWDDLNGNGVQDAGEPGLGAPALELIDSSNVVLRTATSLGDGRYHFPDAPTTAGLSVRVGGGVPTGYALTRFDVNDGNAFPDARDSDASPGLLPLVVASLPEALTGVNEDSVDIGFTRGAVSGFVWRDSNANGLRNLGEVRLNDVTVQLVDSSDVVVDEMTTRFELGPDGQPGFYSFTGLELGAAYRIRIPNSEFQPSTGTLLVGSANSPNVVNGDQALPNGLPGASDVEIAFTPTSADIAAGTHVNNLARFGFYQGSVGDFVWLDLNRDGVVDDPAEITLGQNGIRLFIDLNANGVIDVGEPVTVTSNSPLSGLPGYYFFDGLPLGADYRVALDPAQFAEGGALEGFGVSPNVTDGAPLPNYFYRESGLLDISPDNNNLDMEFGLTRASVGNVVFLDANGNGVRDLVGDPLALEPGIPDVTVRVYRVTTNVLVGEFVTDANGAYSIPNLPSVNYYTTFDLSTVTDPAFTDLVGSPIDPARGVNPGENSPVDTNDYSDLQADAVDANALLWRTPNFVPLVGADNNGVDAAFYQLTSVAGRAFFDSDDDALDSDPAEPAMRAVTVRLLRAGVEVADTTTDTTGAYSFEDVAPGIYTLAFTNPVPATFAFVAAGDPANSLASQADSAGEAVITLLSGTPLEGVRAGFRGQGILEGLIFEDVDGSATQSQTSGAEDTTLAGGNAALNVTVNLPNLVATYSPAVDTSLTPASFGEPNYRFVNLVAGTGVSYSLTFAPPSAAYVTTVANAGSNDAIDSDGPFDGSALVISNPIIGPNPFDYDQGYYQPVTVSARVFEDLSLPTNNEWNTGEPGIESAAVSLVYLGPLSAADWGARLPSDPASTIAGGLADFTSLPPGEYRIDVPVPTGYLRVPGNTGAVLTDLIPSGGDSLTELADPGTTNVFGHAQPATVSGLVFFDGGSAAPDNALLDEPPMTGVSVRLLNGTTEAVVDTTTTDSADGTYSFENVLPGSYIVEFDNPDTANFAYSTGALGDNSVNLTVSSDGRTAAFDLLSGGDQTRNAAVVGTGTVAGLVWEDEDGDGASAGDPALEGAGVSLSLSVSLTNLNTTIERPLAATLADGLYSFAGLPSGTISNLEFTAPTGATWAPTVGGFDSDGPTITGASFTADAVTPASYDQGYYQPVTVSARVFEDLSLPTNNEWNTDEPGLPGAEVRLVYSGPLADAGAAWGALLPSDPASTGVGGLAQFASLPPGEYRLEVTTPTGYLPVTGNAGFIDLGTLTSGGSSETEASPVGTTNVFGYARPVTVSGVVWFDRDGSGARNTGDALLNGVSVEVINLGADGALGGAGADADTLVTVTTNASGAFSSNTLPPGTFLVRVANPSSDDFAFIVVADPVNGSDVDATGVTASFTVVSGGSASRDAGLTGVRTLSGLVFEDSDGDGLSTSETGLNDATISLSFTVNSALNSLFAVADRSYTRAATSAGGGSYSIDGLPRGTLTTLSFTAPTGASPAWVATVADVGANANDLIDSDGPSLSSVTLDTSDLAFDQGYYQPVTVSARVFEDLSLPTNNEWNTDEPGLPGAEVRLVYSGPLADAGAAWGALLPSDPASTGVGGLAQFASLPPGEYRLEVTTPTGYLPVTGNAGFIDLGTLTSGGSSETEASPVGTTNVFGYARPVTVSGVVWFDRDGSGARNPGDALLNGVSVEVINLGADGALGGAGADADTLVTVTTNASGAFSSNTLPPGTFLVRVANPSSDDFAFIVVADPANGSDVDATGVTASFTVVSGGSASRDAGLTGVRTLSGLVFEDSDGDGLSTGETGLNDATISLSFTVNSVLNSLFAVADRSYTRAATSAGGGSYSIDGLPRGTLTTLSFTAPTGASPAWVATVADVGANANDLIDSDGPSLSSVTLDTSDLAFDQGYYQPVTVSARVFEDLSLPTNNEWNTDEPGITGATVRLDYSGPLALADRPASLPSAPLTTGTNGLVSFEGLPPGAYELVVVTTPAGFSAVAGNTGTLAVGPIASGGSSETETSPVGTTNVFGYAQPATVSGYVWFDDNGDGTRDTPEAPMTGVSVELIEVGPNGVFDNGGDDGTPVALTTITGGVTSGQFLATDVPPGRYVVRVTNPSAANFAFRVGVAGEDNAIRFIESGLGRTEVFEATSGSLIDGQDVGMIGVGSIAGEVWVDKNADGSRDLDDEGLSDASVSLTLAVDLTVGGFNLTTTLERTLAATGSDGAYSFTGLPSGTIASLDFTPPVATPIWNETTTTDPDSNGSSAAGAAFTANALGVTAYNQGYYQDVTIVARVFDERVTVNNSFDEGEFGLGGVLVTLSAGGNPLLVRTSTADGLVTFEARPDANFELSLPTPVGFTASPGNTGLVNLGALNSGASNTTEPTPFGYYVPSSITGTAWFDSNRDGLLDAGEPPMQGLEVTLLGISGATETTVATWPATGAAGGYSFAKVDPTGLDYTGYRICFALPTGFAATTKGAELTTDDNSDLNADGCTDAFTLGSNNVVDYIDAGFTGLARIGGVIFDDLNADGLQDAGEPGLAEAVVTVEVTSTGINSLNPSLTLSATSTTAGYLIEGVPPASSYRVVSVTPPLGYLPSTPIVTDPVAVAIPPDVTDLDFGFYATTTVGDLVWLDLNGNGSFNEGEPGVPGVTVELRDAESAVLATTTTDQAGGYAFSELEPGTYSLRFVAPDGYVFTNDGAGSLAVDGDNDAALDGSTGQFTLASGEILGSVDAGLRGTASIAGLVWVDENRNDLRDTDELGRLPGVAVALSLEVAGAEAPITVDTVTGEDGSYSFDGLPAGSATLTFTTPAGYTPVRQNVGANDEVDSDGPVATFALAAGAALSNVDQGYLQANRVIYLPLVISPAGQPDLTVSFSVTPASPQAFSPASISVTVTNRGTAPASNFWVDFYINPSKTPAVNEPWNELCGITPCDGLAWFYSGVLQPGASVVLNSSPRAVGNPNGYVPEASIWPGSFVNGVSKLFVYVDSWNRDASGTVRDPLGAVDESDETNNRAEQDIVVTPGTPPANNALLSSNLVLDRNLLQP